MANVGDTCTVTIDGEHVTVNDFVAIITKQDGNTVLVYNTDALTLGIGNKLLSAVFAQEMVKCTPEEREEIKAVLTGEHLYNTIPEAPIEQQRPKLSVIVNNNKEPEVTQ